MFKIHGSWLQYVGPKSCSLQYVVQEKCGNVLLMSGGFNHLLMKLMSSKMCEEVQNLFKILMNFYFFCITRNHNLF